MLSEPSLLEMMFNCTSASAYWLSQVAFHVDFNDNSQAFAPLTHIEITFPLKNKIPFTLK